MNSPDLKGNSPDLSPSFPDLEENSPDLGKELPGFEVPKESLDADFVFKVLELLIGDFVSRKKLFEVYRVLGPDKFLELAALLDGQKLQLPDREELKEKLDFATCYFERRVKRTSWSDTIKKYPSVTMSQNRYAILAKMLDTNIHDLLEAHARTFLETNFPKDSKKKEGKSAWKK